MKAQLERIVSSRAFSGAHRSQHFLRYILQHALAEPDEHLKEYSIAIDVFERDASYDPAVNNTVRVEAGRLRSRLLEYYAVEGHADPLLFEVPKGSYRVLIHAREADPPSSLPASPAPVPVSPAQPARLGQLWPITLALLVGALFGYRLSR